MRHWLHRPLPPDVDAALTRLRRQPDVARIAVMPDVHLANEVCVGTVLATARLLYPHAVGGDIGCGMAAIAFDCDAQVLKSAAAAQRTLDGLRERVPVARHHRRSMREWPEALHAQRLSDPRLDALREREGCAQLGTLGRGNHFLEFQGDTHGRLWLMVHSGSRGMGQAINAHHLQGADRATADLPCLDLTAGPGQAYLHDVTWALAYATANRRRMLETACDLVRQLFGGPALAETYHDGSHNHVRLEEHGGQRLLVHRKGASPAGDDEPGMIPGSMGTCSFHVLGRGYGESLRSSSHGAGRALDRHAARRAITLAQFRRQMLGVWFDPRLADRMRDEAPDAYNDIHAVMRAQRDLTRITRELRPVLVYKGG